MNNKLEAAVRYARRGIAVVPLHNPLPEGGCSCHKKRDCAKCGKHPRINDWTNQSTTDEATIRGWWAQWPDANVGIVTGAKSGLLVVDVDDKNDGEGSASLTELEVEHGNLPLTPTVKTGFGRHIYFDRPGFPVNNQVGKIGKGLDIRADGGLVVAPPSVHASGAEYEWLDENLPFAAAPPWLIELLKKPRTETLLLERVAGLWSHDVTALDRFETIPQGERNNTLHRLGSSMRGKGMNADDIENGLAQFNEAKCSPPLPRDEVKTIAQSVRRYVPGKRPSTMVGVPNTKNPLFWMKVFPNELLSHRHLKNLPDHQFGWHRRLHYEAWGSGGVLPNDVIALAKLANASSIDLFVHEMDEVLFDFEPAEIEGQAVLINRDLQTLYAEQMEKYRKKLDASAKGVAAKKARAEVEPKAENHASWQRQPDQEY